MKIYFCKVNAIFVLLVPIGIPMKIYFCKVNAIFVLLVPIGIPLERFV